VPLRVRQEIQEVSWSGNGGVRQAKGQLMVEAIGGPILRDGWEQK
jgi:hypothetical protein